MKRKNVGISLAAAGLLAGAFLAGGLLFSSGDSSATSSSGSGATNAIVTPTTTATQAPSATPKATTVPPTPASGETVTPAEGAGGVLSPIDANEGGGGAGGNGGSGSGGGATQPAAPVAPTVAPVGPTQPPAPVEPTAIPTLVVPTAVPPTPVPPTVEPTVVVVNEAPFATGSTPADGQTGLALATTISVTFSEAMDAAATEAAFSISPNVSGTFQWSNGETVLTFTPDAPFSYNTKVEWAVAQTATDQSGLAMTADFSSTFMVLRQKTINLYSQPARDGFVYAPSVNVLQPVVTAGFNGHNSLMVGSWKRGFLSFDLSQLPATTVDITAAELSIHQRAHHASAYTAETGALWIVSLPYGDLDIGDYAKPTPTICPNVCYPLGVELSSSASDGWKSADLTLLVRADWNNSKGDITAEVLPGTKERLSQFRLQFLNENKGAGPDVWAEFHSGEAGGSAPKLRVTFVYK